MNRRDQFTKTIISCAEASTLQDVVNEVRAKGWALEDCVIEFATDDCEERTIVIQGYRDPTPAESALREAILEEHRKRMEADERATLTRLLAKYGPAAT